MRTPQAIIDDIGERKMQLEIAQEGFAEANNARERAHYEAACHAEYDEITELETELADAFAAEEDEG